MKRSKVTTCKQLFAVLAFTVLAPLSGFPTLPAHGAEVVSEVRVLMKDYKFNPSSVVASEGQAIKVDVGATVTWSNADLESHDITILEGPELNVSPEIKNGQAWSMKFTKAGRYHYYCEFHPSMVSDIIVGGVNSTANLDQVSSSFKETGRAVR